jgi:ABC-2 type transport system permease protein
MQALRRELRLLLRQRGKRALLGFVLLTVVASLVLGILEADGQQARIDRLRVADQRERAADLAEAEDWGGAAYHAFFLTYAPPPPLAFVALGQRDVSPWLLRVRALALEGQIYESDRDNPELALLGRLDYAFVVAFLVPLFVAALLHDLVARERDEGRFGLLLATAATGTRLWPPRVTAVLVSLLPCLLLPFVLVAAWRGVSMTDIVAVALVVVAQTAVWTALTLWFAFRTWDAARIAAALAGLWLVLCLLLPMGAKLVIERAVTSVSGAEIALRQREAVNDAWDLPKDVTMQAFFAVHPEWADTTPVVAPFHWKWYYAFQHVGDVSVAPLSAAYREAKQRREAWTTWVALVSPAIAVQRILTRLADTDVAASLQFEARIRDFHARLREFWYPWLFDERPFAREALRGLPAFEPRDSLPGAR